MPDKPKQTDFRIINMVRDNPDLLVTQDKPDLTEKQQREYRDKVLYCASIYANVRARLEKFGECLVDKSDLEGIWKDEGIDPFVPANASFKYRIKFMAEELDATIDKSWPDSTEVRFIKNREIIQVAHAAI